jgi:hypothetical protein
VVNNWKYTTFVINIHFATCRSTGFVGCLLSVTTNKILETGSLSGLRWKDMATSIAASATGRGKS